MKPKAMQPCEKLYALAKDFRHIGRWLEQASEKTRPPACIPGLTDTEVYAAGIAAQALEACRLAITSMFDGVNGQAITPGGGTEEAPPSARPAAGRRKGGDP